MRKKRWSDLYEGAETREQALIRSYNRIKENRYGYLGVLADKFDTTPMAINKKLGALKRRDCIKSAPPKFVDERSGVDTGHEWDENLDKGFAKLNVVSDQFWELEELLKKHNIDEDIWEVSSIRRGVWTTPIAARVHDGKVIRDEKLVTNYHIKVSFKLRKKDYFKDAAMDLIEKIPLFKYEKNVPKFTAPSGVALEIVPIDAHFAKLAWGVETLREDYDLEIAVAQYAQVIEQNLVWGSVFKPEKIFFIVGNDLMHSENYSGTTPSGHNILDVDTRLPMLIEAALEINIKAVYQCRKVSPVEVIWIPGNHDPTSSLWLCTAMKEHFKDDKQVTVDVSPAVRKARLWGSLLVGWTHAITGSHAAWANELAQSFPELWGKSKYREWHHGHKHKKREIKTHPVMTHGGVLCRQLTALSPIDAWHFENLFTDAVPGGEALLWSKDKGVFSNFVAWI